MSRPRLVILGYSEAAMSLRGASPLSVSAVLSIHGRREFGVEAAVPHRLDLAFDDVEVPTPGDELSVLRTAGRRRWAEANGLPEVPPTSADAAAIVGFAKVLAEAQPAGVPLCHCAGGMSRAPAAALICLAVWGGPGSESASVAEVRRLRRGAVPHAGLVRFADDLLGRGGRLVAALSEPRSGEKSDSGVTGV